MFAAERGGRTKAAEGYAFEMHARIRWLAADAAILRQTRQQRTEIEFH